jgi:hypothetical protein
VATLKKTYETNTFRQELLQCAALSFFIINSEATNRDFFDYIENFADGKDPEKVLSKVKAQYNNNIKTHLGVYYTSSSAGISWVKSSIDIARFLISKLNLNENFEIHHQKSVFGKLIKDDCIKKIVDALGTKSISNKSDVYNPTDIWIVNKNYQETIESELKKYISENTSSDNITSILANYIENKHTYKSILNRYYLENKLFQVSLKKSKTSNTVADESYKDIKKSTPINVGYKIIGTLMNYAKTKIDIDSYTKFVFAFDELLRENNKGKILKFIDDLVHIDKLNYKDETLQPNLIFHLDYAGVAIDGGGFEKWKMDTPGNTFNMQKIGGTAWSGGLNTNGIHEILSNYTGYNSIFNKVVNIRNKAFEEVYNGLTKETVIPSTVRSVLNKSEIIYKQKDLKVILDNLNPTAYMYYLAKSIEELSKPYRGQLERYGVSGSEGLQLTKKVTTIVIKNGKEEEVTETVSTLKKGQNVVKLTTRQLIAKSTTIEYDKIISGKITQVNPGDYIFIVDKNNKLESGTKIVSINRTKKIITISKALTGGTKANAPQATAVILNPMQTNIVSSDELTKIKGSISKSQTYLEEKYSKLQAFYMFMEGGPSLLNDVLKKQIVLTIYGLVSKKGGKLFDPDLYDEVKGKIFTKNAISQYVIPAFIIVGD